MSDTATFVTVDGVRLETREWPGREGAAATPILLLHEGLGSVSMWRDFPASLAERTGRRVVAWSRQGYGRSDPMPGPFAPDYMHREAEKLPTLMDALGLERAHLFGHSDGGSIALIAAAHHPARIASLILEAPHVHVERITHDSIAAVKEVFAATDLAQRLGRHHADPAHSFRLWNDIWLDPRFRDWSIEALLPRIRAPALLIQGQGDEYGTLDQLDRIEAALPAARRLELASCGHSPHRDQPDAVLAAVAAFLGDFS
ncbi:MAG TPA: alpha/beta hydrolase [Hyphomicrobiales bacterium]|nr:alpha/beta hydrolase [Hyphomicrobiales bacterium]